MAFATSNLAREGSGSMAVLRGTWTGTNGDASGTVTGSGYCHAAMFRPNTTTGPSNVIQTRVSNSSGTWTVTVPYQETVTAGTFSIEFK
jgi:hypothetical protein